MISNMILKINYWAALEFRKKLSFRLRNVFTPFETGLSAAIAEPHALVR